MVKGMLDINHFKELHVLKAHAACHHSSLVVGQECALAICQLGVLLCIYNVGMCQRQLLHTIIIPCQLSQAHTVVQTSRTQKGKHMILPQKQSVRMAGAHAGYSTFGGNQQQVCRQELVRVLLQIA